MKTIKKMTIKVSLLQNIFSVRTVSLELDSVKLEEDTELKFSNSTRTSLMPEDCRLEVWQCMSSVLEKCIKYVETPPDIYR